MDLSADAADSFSSWVYVRRNALLRAAYLLTLDRARAEDLLQDSLIKVARRWGRLRDGDPEAYLRRVMYNAQISWWRRHRETPVPDVLGATPEATDPDRDIVIRQALRRLSPGQRAVVVLRYFEDATERETADALGVTVGTVKSQTHAALRKLRDAAPELGELIGRAEESR